MLKLLRYEFRKGMTPLIVMLSITAGLESYFLVSLFTEQTIQLILACFLLLMATLAVYVFAFIKGVTNYSSEMKSRSAYLIFMTPNSGLKIMGAKYLYTFLIGLLFASLYVGMGVLDIGLLLAQVTEIEDFFDVVKELLMALGYGVRFDQILLTVVASGIYFFLNVLSIISLAYMAITLSHTLFRDKKWRGMVSVGLFILMYWLLSKINGMLPSAYDQMVFQEPAGSVIIQEEYGFQTGMTLQSTLLTQLPQAAVSLAVNLLSLFGCAWMLDRKVSL